MMQGNTETPIRIDLEGLESRADARARSVSGLFVRPDDAWCLYVMAHGAGAGMEHRFMGAAAIAFARVGIATLRFNFPAMESGRRRPDSPAVAQAAVRAAVERARAIAGGGEAAVEAGAGEKERAGARGAACTLALFAGGKSFGGRMTSAAVAEAPLPGVRGLVFLGFPLHPAGRPGIARAEHLSNIPLPMLFLQGTRDALADPALIRDVTDDLGPRASLRMIDGADHSFAVLKRSGRTEAEVLEELAGSTERCLRSWLRSD